jgi:hypothetical protein
MVELRRHCQGARHLARGSTPKGYLDLEAEQARTRPDDARTKRPDDARTVAALDEAACR